MKVLMIATMSLITATSALAQYGGYGQQQEERIQLHLQQHLQGQNTIQLKKEIKLQYPHINIQELEVQAVRVVAKSKAGRGEVVLISGQSASYPQTVGGNPRDFDFGGPDSFDKILIQNPARVMSHSGILQLELKGNIKLKKVVVITKAQMQREQNIMINTYGQHLQGANTLKLKQMIKMQNPGLDLQELKLKSVTLISKSRMGRAQATLIVGQSASYPATIFGNPGMFDSPAPRTFSPVTLINPSYDSQGVWQVDLQGNIKIEKVIVTVQGIRGGGYSPIPTPGPRPIPGPRPRPRRM